MKETLATLIRLQELEFVLSEQETLVDDAEVATLETSIQELLASLPRESAVLYRKLRQRNLAVVVPATRGACSVCGFVLPTSQVAAVQKAEQLQRCRNCGRILYEPEQLLRRHGVSRSAKSLPSGPARFSSPALMLPGLAADSCEGALSEIIERLAAQGVVDTPAVLLELALERERIASTALDNGLAFPHVRGVEGGGMVFALGIKSEGLVFDERSDRVARMIFFTVIPSAASSLYLRLVADLLEPLQHEHARAELLACRTEQALWRGLAHLKSES